MTKHSAKTIASCERKANYKTLKAAKKETKRRRRYGHALKPYKCTRCRYYHLASANRKRNKKVKE